MIQAVRMTKLPTLTTADSERFASLLRCQFGDAVGREVEDESLQGAIRATMKETGLVEDEAQVQKVVQLEMATRQRIGVIIVGPSGSGKSSLWQILEGAYRKLGRKLKTHKMNPKAIDRKQLLGSLDLDTREWTDGVLTAAARQVVKEDIDVRSWIICDGDVDPEWIESLNSVLDDNRLLTLPNGERIQLGAGNVNFIFECHSLQYASPATVSRCGMIFISEEARDIRKDLTKWVTGLEKEGADVTGLRQWADDLLPKIFREALTFDAAVETTAMGRLRSGLSHAADATSRAAFTRALATGFSANMLPPVRSRFLSAVGRAAGDPAAAKIAVPGTLAEAMGLEDAWEDASSGLIATAGVLETASVLGPWLSNGDPVIVAGPEGSGKASLLEKLVDMLPGRTQVAQIACSSSTGAAAVIAKLKQVCGKPKVRGSGKVLASPSGGRVVLLVRDVDLPRPDKYGTVQLVALLQQLVTYGGFYDESEGLEFVSLEGIQIACTMSPQGTVGRHRLSPRLTANVRVCYIDAPSRDELLEIFTRRMDAVVSHIQGLGGSSPAATALAEALVDSFDDARGAFSANDHRHYALTPRHLGEWTEGLLHYDMQDASSVPEAVLYEGCRVLQDRMVSESDGASMGSILGGKVRAALRGEAKGDAVFTLAGEPLTRGSVLVRMKLADYKEMVADRLRVFSREELEAPLVLFPAFLRRVAAVERALMRPGGALLLVGPSGAGRRSAALLAAHMMRMRVVSPRMVRGYGAKNFAADLKDALESAGTREEPTLLLVGDAQLVSDAFLEHINAWLSAGEIVGLLSKEDRERLVGPLEDHPQRAEFGTADALFLHRARSNLRVCVCMDPSSPDFARRCESNPALFGRCTVAWSSGWGDEGSQAVASHVLSESLPPKDLPVVVRSALSLCEGAEDARPPPRKLDALLRCFVGIMEQKRTETAEQLQHLRAGMEKLREASEMVDKLSREAEEQQTKLGAAQEEAEKALQKITATMESANARKAEVEKLSRKLAEDEVEIQRRKGGVEAELADVQPQIDAARAAVGSIKKEHLSEIKSMKAPPDAIRDVLEAVMKLMGIKDTTWSAMRNFLSQGGFKERIINFDARNIDDPTHADVSSLTAKRASSFDREKIAYVSRAAAPLAAWTMANLKYSRVLQQVAPLESMLSEITQQHAKAQKEKDAAQREIDKLESSIEGLKAEYAAKTGQAEQLKIGLKRAEETLQRATGLLGALVGERDRWEQQVGQLERDLDALPANALMAAAFCVFLPGEPEDVRSDRVSEWAPLVGLDGGWSFTRFMSSERQVLGWKAEGLPSDALSVENAVALLTGKQAPYVVDPSGSAAAWLEAHMKGAGHAVKITAPHAKNFSNALELAVRFGEALIVRDVDRIDPILVPLLRGDRYKQGPRSVVLVGDKLIDFEPRFRIFLVTRSPAPALTPQEEALVSVVNFSVTRAGLEAQLLGLTIQHEKPQLEKQLRELLREEEDMKVQLSDLEKSLLDTLAAAQGNILENEVLSRTLNETKHKAQVVEDALRDSAVAQEALAQERSVYAPVASLGSSVFFAIRDLRTVNHVYQISLPAFLSIVSTAVTPTQSHACMPSTASITHPCPAPCELAPSLPPFGLLSLFRARCSVAAR